MKILAMYLPQFHRIKENDEWWGNGYTEWNAVKNAKKYYSDHLQPKKPLNGFYYDLSDEDAKAWKWQANLANKYGVYGFCIYHYWFKTGEQLLERPMEILLRHPEININYCICWANETWKRTWYGVESEILKEQSYGDIEEWENHFYYMLQFFKDKRYIKVNNKPMICIYRSAYIQSLEKMRLVWDELAIKNGFDGVFIVSGNTGQKLDVRSSIIDAYYNYEPVYTYSHNMQFMKKSIIVVKRELKKIINRFKKDKCVQTIIESKNIYERNTIFASKTKTYLGTFVGYDDTPRRQYKGTVYVGNVEDFYENLCSIARRLTKLGAYDDFVFVTAWNEWGEGAYLEPDETNGYAYLEALKRAVDEVNAEK